LQEFQVSLSVLKICILSHFARETMFWFCLVQTSFGGKLLEPFHALLVGLNIKAMVKPKANAAETN